MTTILDGTCINTIRALAVDAIERAKSGHPGMPLGAAPLAYVLWQRHLRHHPLEPSWPNRDRFVLSAGHGSMLQYALLHLNGYDLSVDDLRAFRAWGSRTPGHPEFGVTPGVEATTGPLGQGFANAVGMAIAERMLAQWLNRPGFEIIDHMTYVLASDGDLMEGVATEAASLAGHLRLGKLVCLYDANDVTLDGPASLTFTEDVAMRHQASGWHVQTVRDGNHDLDAIDHAIVAAREETERPSLIIVNTTLGFGSPNKAGTPAAHGSPLGPEEAELTKNQIGWEHREPFFVPEEVRAHMASARGRGEKLVAKWNDLRQAWAAEYPELAEHYALALRGQLPSGWDEELEGYAAGTVTPSRVASGDALNALAARVRWLVGGDADLGSSTKTRIFSSGAFSGESGNGRNIHFGVREHAMAAVANGIAYHGGLKPFVGTFFQFCDYMRPAMRLSAMSGLPVIYLFTHDSVAVGEDGPTHQPIEHLMGLRVIPNLTVIRPADSNETHEAWKVAMQRQDGPVALVLSRQKLPALEETSGGSAAGLSRGAYILKDPPSGDPQCLIIASGSEVGVALDAQQRLLEEGLEARVVSMPSWELFAAQNDAYRETVLPTKVKARVSLEAGATLGWERWIGCCGQSVGIDRFGASAPGGVVMEKLGITADAVIARVRQVLGRARPHTRGEKATTCC